MKRIKGIIFGIVIGMLLGLWFGFNTGRDRPLLSNPFAEPTLREKIKQTGDDLIEKSGQVLEKSGQALQQKAKEADAPAMPEPFGQQ